VRAAPAARPQVRLVVGKSSWRREIIQLNKGLNASEMLCVVSRSPLFTGKFANMEGELGQLGSNWDRAGLLDVR